MRGPESKLYQKFGKNVPMHSRIFGLKVGLKYKRMKIDLNGICDTI